MTDNRSKNRFVTVGDEYQREIITREIPRTIPLVDICEEPSYTISINQEWAAHIFGAIATLILPQAWDGEENERNVAVQQIMKLLAMECSPPMDCETIADCIETSENVQTTLNNYFTTTNQNGGVGNINEPLPDAKLNENWYTEEECDLDELWGACEEVIDGMFGATLELLQKLALTTNATDLFAEMLEAIPLIGGLLSFGYEVATWGIETALPLFLAVDSPLVRRELACDLFCLCSDDCDLSMNKVIEVFNDAGVEEPPWSTEVLPNLEWIIALALSGNPDKAIAASIATLGVIIVKHGGRFGKIILGVDSYQQLAAYGAANNANTGWSIYCDCVTWEKLFDFSINGDDWEIAPDGRGSYQFPLGFLHEEWYPEPGRTRRSVNGLQTVLKEVTGLTHVGVVFTLYPKGTFYSGLLFGTIIDALPGVYTSELVGWLSNGYNLHSATFPPMTTTDGVKVFALASDRFGGIDGNLRVERILLKGVGPDPFA